MTAKHRTRDFSSAGILLAECTGLAVLVFGMYLFRIRPFHINNDQMFQYPVFYQEWVRLIRDCLAGRGLPLYSWRMFLGTDFYSAMAYYVTGDVFLPLFFLFDIETALLIETVLCFYIACFAMYAFLRKTSVSAGNARFLSLIYSFGGWGMLYIGQYMFHRFYAFLPLLLLGAELYFQNRRHLPAALAVFLLFLTNYYLMWPASLLLLLYCIVRESERHVSRREFLGDLVHLLGAYLAGMAAAGFLLVPAVLYVIQNPRVGAVNNSGLFWPLKVYAGWLLSFVNSPFPVYTGYANLFRLDDNGYGYWYTLFVTVIPLITALSWMMKKEHRAWLILTAVLAVSAWLKPLSVIFHGLSDPSMRWMFVIEIIVLLCAGRAMDEERDARSVRRIALCCGMLCIGSLILTAVIMGTDAEYLPHYASLLACLVLAGVEWFLYARGKTKPALILSVLEIGCCSAFMQYCFFHDVVYTDYRLSSPEFAYLMDTDPSLLFRTWFPIDDSLPGYPDLNNSMRYDFLSVRTYNSLYDTTTNPFLSLMGISEHRIDITNPDALDMLGVRYVLAENESELPAGRDYEYVTSLEDSLGVWRNLSCPGFGYAGEKVGRFASVSSVSQLKNGVFVSDPEFDLSRYDQASFAPFAAEIVTTDYLRGTVDLSAPNILYLPIPCAKGWSVRTDGVPAEIVNVNGGFIGIPLEAGMHTVELNFMSPGLKGGILLSGIGVLGFIVLLLLDRRHRRCAHADAVKC